MGLVQQAEAQRTKACRKPQAPGAGDSQAGEFVSKAKDASILITEGTWAGLSEDQRTTEQPVCEICRESGEYSSGQILADFSPRNLSGWGSPRRSPVRLEGAGGHGLGHLYAACLAVCQALLHARIPADLRGDLGQVKKEVGARVVQSEYGDQYVDHVSIRDAPKSYILCFSLFDMNHSLDIKPVGGGKC